VGHDPVAEREAGHRAAGPGDSADGLNAERHWRTPPKIPAAGTRTSSQFPTPAQHTPSTTSSGRSSPGPGQLEGAQQGPSSDLSPLLARMLLPRAMAVTAFVLPLAVVATALT
jgi:hypothetical protein